LNAIFFIWIRLIMLRQFSSNCEVVWQQGFLLG